MRGLPALELMFARADEQSRPAFLPYYPVGYPDLERSLDAIVAMSRAGVDGFEIGIPFSDPLADGPTIQAATQRSLEQGTTVRDCVAAVRTLRERGVNQPLLLMGYLNPLLAYGVEEFVADIREAGADGLLVPDLPPDEGQEICDICERAGMALVFFLAPTSDARRIRLVDRHSSGFIYCVSLTGVTGERDALPQDLQDFIARVRAGARNRLVLGFGISTPQQARQMNGLVDGFVVGSALVRAGAEGPAATGALAASLRDSLELD